MLIKIGNLEFTEWVKPEGWHTPYRFIPSPDDPQRDFSKPPTLRYLGYVMVNYGSDRKWFVEFDGAIEHFESSFIKRSYSSYEEAQEDVDAFLIKISKLAAFF